MFITFEGAEGSGKTSQMANLAKFLQGQGYPVLATREPGGTPIGDKIRAVLLDREHTAMQPRTEILLFQASRAQLVDEIIRPFLEQGGIVLCDRYADSTLAYQGFGYQNDLAHLRSIVDFATGGLKPDLTIMLDVDIEVGLQRRAKGGALNRLDTYELAFYQRVRQGYLQLVQEDPGRWVVVDANLPYNRVQAEIRQIVLARLSTHQLASP